MLPTLYPFQIEDVRQHHTFKGLVFNGLQMGLGKTLETLTYIQELETERPAIVICPASLKTNWQNEALKFYEQSSCILETKKPIIMKSYRKKELVIVNYDILEAWLPFLVSLKAPIIVMDEGQMISGIRAKRTRICTYLAKKSKRRIVLDGTPINNRPWELFPKLHLIRPDVWNSPFSFGMTYCQGDNDGSGWQFKGAENLSQLHRVLKETLMIRRTKAEVLPDLPEKRRFVLTLNIDNREEYRRAETDLIGWLASYDPIRAQRAQRAERFVRFGYLKRLAAKLKMRAVYDWIDLVLASTDRKLVLGAIHRKGDYPIIPWLLQRYEKIASTIHGGTSMAQRDIAKKRFNEDPTCRIIVLQNQAGGMGINLQGERRTVALVELPWAPGHIQQVIDRCHRIGTPDYVDVYFLIAQNTIEHRLCEIIQRKQSISDQAIDGVEGNADSLSILDELTLAMTNRKVPILQKKRF